MDWVQTLGDINYLAVLAAAVASFVLGFVWYSWPVFGKTWAGLLGMTKEEADDTEGIGEALGGAVVGSLIAAAFLAATMHATGTDSVAGGAVFGAIAGIALRYTSLLYHNGFAKQPRMLTVIDGVHDVVQLAMMGAIIGAIS
jgi:hypothetical protein